MHDRLRATNKVIQKYNVQRPVYLVPHVFEISNTATLSHGCGSLLDLINNKSEREGDEDEFVECKFVGRVTRVIREDNPVVEPHPEHEEYHCSYEARDGCEKHINTTGVSNEVPDTLRPLYPASQELEFEHILLCVH